jgi:hypothetical protein
MVLEVTKSLQCLNVKGFKATQLLCCKNVCFGKKKSQIRRHFKKDKATKSLS